MTIDAEVMPQEPSPLIDFSRLQVGPLSAKFLPHGEGPQFFNLSQAAEYS